MQTGIDKDGYSRVSVGGTRRAAHRIAWEYYASEPIPDGLQVCHHCDNRRCIAPGHLFVGTNADNQADKARKGRAALPHHLRKLTPDEAATIRASDEQTKILAARYGVNRSTIKRVRNGRTWVRLPQPAEGH